MIPTMGELMARFALADVRRRRQFATYPGPPRWCACGHRLEDHHELTDECLNLDDETGCACEAFREED